VPYRALHFSKQSAASGRYRPPGHRRPQAGGACRDGRTSTTNAVGGSPGHALRASANTRSPGGGTYLVPVTGLLAARERARRGDRDAAIAVMRQALDELHHAGRLGFGVWGTGLLVETLLERGSKGDLSEAQEAIDRMANLPATESWVVREITLLRVRALLARARGDEMEYRDLVSRYLAMAESLGFEGHIKWAEAMP
jgi:hypothetical protein